MLPSIEDGFVTIGAGDRSRRIGVSIGSRGIGAYDGSRGTGDGIYDQLADNRCALRVAKDYNVTVKSGFLRLVDC